MKTCKVIIFGMGTVGKDVVKALDTKQGVEIVGALDKVNAGKDIGEISGLGRNLGIQVTDNADELFSKTKADVVFHLVTTSAKDTYEHIKKPIEEGMNVISSAEEMVDADYYSPESAVKIDELARNYGVSVVGGGLWPTYVDIYLPLALSGGTREITRLEYRRKSDFKPYLQSIVLGKFGLNFTKADFEKGLADGTIAGHTGFEGTFNVFADLFGWKLERVEKNCVGYFDDNDVTVSVKHTATGYCDGEPRLYNEIWGSIEDDWAPSDTVVIEGNPSIKMTIDPGVVGTVPVANCLVNQLPFILNAKPGLLKKPLMGMYAFDGHVMNHVNLEK